MSHTRSKHRRALLCSAIGFLAAAAPTAGYARNLLDVEDIARSDAVIREQRLVDGIVPATGAPIDDFTATLFLGSGAEVLFRTEPVEASGLRFVAIDDSVAVDVSSDGVRFSELALAPGEQVGGMTVWGTDDLPGPLSAIRLRLREGRRMGAVGELVLLRGPTSPLPVRLQAPPTYQEAVDQVLDRKDLIRRVSIGVSLLALPALAAAIGWTGRKRLLASILLMATGAFVWLGLGTLRGDGGLIHPWELTHYYLGSKYFDELRYRELYRCLAAHERRHGRESMVERAEIRDLDDNRLHRGGWSGTADGACRAGFSPERWAAFSEDADRLRRLFRYRHFHSMLRDHGYNATPLQTVALRQLTDRVRPTRTSLGALSILDMSLLWLSVALIAWAFGPLPGAVAALLVGFGHAWDYSWTGGSLGRYLWLVAGVAGMAFLKKGRPVAGTLLLVFSGMLRLFPLVLLAGLGWRILRRTISRQWQPEDRRIAVGAVVALLVGLALPLASYGGDVYQEFLTNTRLHASRPPGNDLGLGAFRGLGSSSTEGTRLPVEAIAPRAGWAVGIVLAILLIVRVERRGASSWELIVWSGPLLFAALPLSGYDYVWLILLAPILAGTGRRALPAVLLVAMGKLAPELFADDLRQHLAINTLLLAGLLALVTDEIVRSRRRKAPVGASGELELTKS